MYVYLIRVQVLSYLVYHIGVSKVMTIWSGRWLPAIWKKILPPSET
jgi:hypothetical protein